ncbi:MAG TPA: PKD domain-containing protein [Rhodanobacteraceae bacterium]|nr:PKD domain-containing protein [Rhodanobacteraceae bacterium]
MAKPPACELSGAGKRDLTGLIRAGKPLPEKYRLSLFEDKREVDLVGNGKTRDVCTTADHTYDRPGRYTVAVKVVDIFDNDTMTLMPVRVG